MAAARSAGANSYLTRPSSGAADWLCREGCMQEQGWGTRGSQEVKEHVSRRHPLGNHLAGLVAHPLTMCQAHLTAPRFTGQCVTLPTVTPGGAASGTAGHSLAGGHSKRLLPALGLPVHTCPPGFGGGLQLPGLSTGAGSRSTQGHVGATGRGEGELGLVRSDPGDHTAHGCHGNRLPV